MSGRTLTLTVRSGDAVVVTFDFEESRQEALVGRSHSCDICTPPSDHSVSGRHARVFRKGHGLWIEDAGSRNGVIIEGSRIEKPSRLEPGMVCRLGECYLTLEEKSGQVSSGPSSSHRLEFLTGDRAGEVVDIRPKGDSTGGAFTIGLDPSNDIVLADRIVSRRHASLTVRHGGDCFVKDLGSSNGTYVNGERLDARERFLHHGDKVSIAYFDFRFLDRRAKAVPSARELWRKLGVLLMLGALLALGWIVYDGIRPSAAIWRDRATRLAAAEDFDGAMSAITNAYAARNGQVERDMTEVLHGQILVWKQTDEKWRAVRTRLEDGNTGGVFEQLREILSRPDNTTWNNSTAAGKREEAEFAYNLVQRLYGLLETLKERPPVRENITRSLSETDEFLKKNAKVFSDRAYLKAAKSNLERLQARLVRLREGMDKIDRAIEVVRGDDPDFREAERILSDVATSGTDADSGALRTHAETLLPTCRKFIESTKFLKDELVLLTSLDFVEVRRRQDVMPLPDKDLCARLPAFSAAREVFLRRHQAYQHEAQLLAPMIRNLTDAGIGEGEVGSLVKSVCAEKTWNEALAFDCFSGRFPEPSRVDPNSVYDGLVGIECTYENLHSLPKAPGRQNSVRMRFIPQTQKAKVVFEQVKTFRSVMDRSEALPLRTGALGELYALAAKIMEMRDALIAQLKVRRHKGVAKGQAMDRAHLIAGFFAEYFSDEPSYADLRALESGFKTLERKVRALNEQFENESDPEKRLKIRNDVIAVGIPGSEEVRKRWVELGE